MKKLIFIFFVVAFCLGCQEKQPPKPELQIPTEIIDLGMLVTEDLPEKIWGKNAMLMMGFEKSNQFDIRRWNISNIAGSNAYYTLFNHGGTHLDGPNHMGFAGGIDSYPVEKFVGPLKVFDVSGYPKGRTIPVEVFKGKVLPGDVVLIYTNWTPPMKEFTTPEFIALTHKAAEYLAQIPVRAFCTEAFSADCFGETNDPIVTDSETAKGAPIHHSFLSRSIPIYEGLVNVEKLLNKQNMLFAGVPINIKDGDGILVRPVVFVY